MRSPDPLSLLGVLVRVLPDRRFSDDGDRIAATEMVQFALRPPLGA
jgi:hypothetical protein